MHKKINDTNIKIQTYYFFDDVRIKDSKYIKINNVNPLYLISNNMNGHFEEINKNKCLTLFRANESKEKILKI